MSSIKVSALTAKTSPSGSEELLINDGGTSKKITIGNLPDTDTVYTHPNHSGEVTSTGDGATVIVDDIVDEANLKISNAPTNGQFLSAQSGNTGGLTWAVPTDTNTVYTHPNHSGDIVSSGDGSTTIQAGAVDIAMLSASGSASGTTFLRGDNSWVVPTDTNTDTKWDGGATGLTAATGRTSLGLVIGTDVQAYDADLATVASSGIGTSANQMVRLDGSAELPAVDGSNLTGLGIPAGTVTSLWNGSVTNAEITLSADIDNYHYLCFLGGSRYWVVTFPVGVFKSNTYGSPSDPGHLLPGYDDGHIWVQWTADTTIDVNSGAVGNPLLRVFGVK